MYDSRMDPLSRPRRTSSEIVRGAPDGFIPHPSPRILQRPELDRPVGASRDDEAPVGRDHDCRDRVPMTGQRAQLATARRSQILTVLSVPPAMTRLPSGVTATCPTSSPWPDSVCSRLPLASSQTLMVLSMLAETICRPSGVTTMELIEPWCPDSACSSRPATRSKTKIVGAEPPAIRYLPSGVTQRWSRSGAENRRSSRPLSRSQIPMVLSALPVTMLAPSRLMSTL